MFESVVTIILQSVFHVKIYQNNIYFFKSFLKLTHQNDPKNI